MPMIVVFHAEDWHAIVLNTDQVQTLRPELGEPAVTRVFLAGQDEPLRVRGTVQEVWANIECRGNPSLSFSESHHWCCEAIALADRVYSGE